MIFARIREGIGHALVFTMVIIGQDACAGGTDVLPHSAVEFEALSESDWVSNRCTRDFSEDELVSYVFSEYGMPDRCTGKLGSVFYADKQFGWMEMSWNNGIKYYEKIKPPETVVVRLVFGDASVDGDALKRLVRQNLERIGFRKIDWNMPSIEAATKDWKTRKREPKDSGTTETVFSAPPDGTNVNARFRYSPQGQLVGVGYNWAL